jgi:hypothetical protein
MLCSPQTFVKTEPCSPAPAEQQNASLPQTAKGVETNPTPTGLLVVNRANRLPDLINSQQSQHGQIVSSTPSSLINPIQQHALVHSVNPQRPAPVVTANLSIQHIRTPNDGNSVNSSQAKTLVPVVIKPLVSTPQTFIRDGNSITSSQGKKLIPVLIKPLVSTTQTIVRNSNLTASSHGNVLPLVIKPLVSTMQSSGCTTSTQNQNVCSSGDFVGNKPESVYVKSEPEDTFTENAAEPEGHVEKVNVPLGIRGPAAYTDGVAGQSPTDLTAGAKSLSVVSTCTISETVLLNVSVLWVYHSFSIHMVKLECFSRYSFVI